MPMQQRRSTRLFTLLTGLLIAGLTLTVSAQGQSPEKSVSSAMLAARPAEAYSYVYLDPLEGNQHGPKVDDGQHQGLQVHGHWIIDVKNSDGTVAQHRDFENSLQSPGAAYLIALMAGYDVPSDYAIVLDSNSNQQSSCQPPTAVTSACVLVHSLTTTPAVSLCANYFCVNNLAYAYVINYNASSFTMSGSYTASAPVMSVLLAPMLAVARET